MSLALTIQPFSDVLDMYGDADLSSTFSLSGHVSVLLSSPSSLFVRRKGTTRILLQSLTITFEGQSETISPETGYTPIRLCSLTRELLPGGPVDISNEGHEDSKPCVWNIVFDIAVPGWLPTTSIYGDASFQETGTSYALYATATFIDINHGRSFFSFANFCGPVRFRACTVDAQRCPVTLRRFIEPESRSSSSAFPMSAYIVEAYREPRPESSSQGSIPGSVLDKIQVVANIPSTVAMNETWLPFVLHIRGKDSDERQKGQLRMTELSIDLEQVEVYRNNVSRDEVDEYPIPSQSHQPPRVPLRYPHPIRTLYDTGFLGTIGSNVKRSFSILAPAESGRYVISGDGHIFNHGSPSEDKWYILETKIPISTAPYLRDWAGAQKRRITENSPLFSVEHYMHVVILCEYTLADETTIPERLHFSLPMRHVNLPEIRMPWRNALESQREDVGKTLPYRQILPAYSQLFHPNGERKLDRSIPLPLYEPSSSSSSEFTSDQHRTL